ncbi:MAG: hypothetical protein Q7S31_01535 [bacterium]|nr:hypothetical protein [bacterium]
MDDQPDVSVASSPTLAEQTLLKWMAPARPFKVRDRQFFTTIIVIAVLVSILMAFAREWMLIAVIASLIFAYYIWSTVPPEEVEYSITSRGVRVHSQLFRWEDLNQWWMEDKWGQKILTIATPLSVTRRLHLLLGNTDEQQVGQVLEKYLVMEKPAETAIDRAGRWVAEKFPLEASR